MVGLLAREPRICLTPHSLQRSCIFEGGETAGDAPLRGHHILIVNINANVSKKLQTKMLMLMLMQMLMLLKKD